MTPRRQRVDTRAGQPWSALASGGPGVSLEEEDHDEDQACGCDRLRPVRARGVGSAGRVRRSGRWPRQQPRVSRTPAAASAGRRMRPLTRCRIESPVPWTVRGSALPSSPGLSRRVAQRALRGQRGYADDRVAARCGIACAPLLEMCASQSDRRRRCLRGHQNAVLRCLG